MSKRKMTGAEYQDAIDKIGISQVGAAKLFGVNEKTSRDWKADRYPPPRCVELLLKVMIKFGIRPDQVANL